MKTHTQSGFSILEVLVAAVILGISFGAFSSLILGSQKQELSIRQSNIAYRQAAAIADNVGENIKSFQIFQRPLSPAALEEHLQSPNNWRWGWSAQGWGPLSDPLYNAMPGRATVVGWTIAGSPGMVMVLVRLRNQQMGFFKDFYKVVEAR
jgi:prepilin-type N-terminal cleavage/methylation domain-containing protein